MNVYFVEKRLEEGGPPLVHALRDAMQSYLPHTRLLPTALERENQFFLKSSESVVWGYVFFHPPVPEDGPKVKREMAKRMETFGPFFYPCVFFPAGLAGAFPFFDLPSTARFFEYLHLSDPSQKAIALREYAAPKERTVGEAAAVRKKVIFAEPDFRGQARLSRQELSELIELSLQLKKSPG